MKNGKKYITYNSSPITHTKSRSSAGQSATLIMQRSAVRACPRLLIKAAGKSLMADGKKVNSNQQEANSTQRGNQLSWLERLPCTQEVKGSTPLFSTIIDGLILKKQIEPKTIFANQIRSRIKIIDINGKDITKRKPSTYKCLSNLKIGKKSLRAYGGCLGFQRRRRTW